MAAAGRAHHQRLKVGVIRRRVRVCIDPLARGAHVAPNAEPMAVNWCRFLFIPEFFVLPDGSGQQR